MRLKILLLNLGLLLLIASPSHAIPIVLDLTVDDPLVGLAVLSGDLEDTFAGFLPGTAETIDIDKTGTNWFVRATIFRGLTNFQDQTYLDYSIALRARHITNPAPHVGETSPGLFLGGGFEVFHGSVTGIVPFGMPGPQDDQHFLIHPGSIDHYDFLASHLDDLNGKDSRGFATLDGQISARISLAHTQVPEPATSLLFASGLLGLGILTGRQK